MRNFLKIFLRSLGTYLGVGGGLTRPSFIVGFNRLVILITYGMRYITMEAVSLVCTFAQDRASSTMWERSSNSPAEHKFFSLVRKPQERKTYAVQEDLTISPFIGFSFCTVSSQELCSSCFLKVHLI